MITLLLACAAPPPPPGPRIVSLHDTTTEIVVGLGRAADLVAVMEPEFLSPEALSAAEGLPRLGVPVSPEALMALHPTLILGTEDVTQHQPELAALPGAVWIDPVGLEGLWGSIGAVAGAMGVDSSTYISSLNDKLPEPVAGDLPVFFYDCCEPPFTMGGRAPLTEILPRLGARNIFADLDQDWGRVSFEAALARGPRLIVVHEYSGEGAPAEKIAVANRIFPGVPTVVLPLGLALEGPRTLDAVAALKPAIEAAR